MADDVAGVHRRSVRRGGMRNNTISAASGREDLSGIRTPLFPAQVFERVNVNPTPDPTTAGAVSGRPKIEPGDPLRRKSLSCSGANWLGVKDGIRNYRQARAAPASFRVDERTGSIHLAGDVNRHPTRHGATPP
jgi:hypothetical protein